MRMQAAGWGLGPGETSTLGTCREAASDVLVLEADAVCAGACCWPAPAGGGPARGLC